MVMGRDLEVRHLMALDAVAKGGTFGRAASHLGYTQSAVSQQIAALERIVGEPVFDRPGGPRPVTLTPLGKLLLGHAREVLRKVDAAANDVKRFQAGEIGRIDIGTFQSVSTAFLPTILGRLRAERPGLEARLIESDEEDELISRMLAGELEVCFLVGDGPPEIEQAELLIDPFVVVALPEDVDGGALPIARLASTPMVGQQNNCCQVFVEKGLREHGIEPDFVFRTNDNSAVMAMVRAGVGMAVMPLLGVEVADPRTVVLTLDPPIPPRRISIGWRRDRTLSPTAVRLIELAQEVTEKLRDRPELAAAAAE